MKNIVLLFASLFVLLYAHSQAGTLDSSFAGKGWTYTDFEKANINSNTYGIQTLLQKDGSYILVLNVNGYTFLTRYFFNGTLDAGFGADGYSQAVNFGSGEAVQQKDGKIVVAGSFYNRFTADDFALARYNTDGSVDSTFGSNGKITTNFGYTVFGYSESVSSVAIQSNGKIVAAGMSEAGVDPEASNKDFAIARYNSDGSLDSTFDKDGKVTIHSGPYSRLTSVAIQGDGKIVVAGTTRSETRNHDFTLVRYNEDGSLDSSFGHDGTVTTDFWLRASVTSMALQNDEKIVVAGGKENDFAIARYNSDGSLDSTFDKDGKVITDFGGYEYATTITIQDYGKIVVTGYTSDFSKKDFALAHYNKDGSLDSTFDEDGKLTFAAAFSDVNSMTIQNDGKMVMTGYIVINNPNSYNPVFALARYNADGSLDKTFDKDGKLTGFYPLKFSFLSAVAVQRDGKVVAAGNCLNPETQTYDFALARYNSDGSLDKSFGGDGKVTTDFFKSGDLVFSLVIQEDGKFVVAGVFNGSTNDFGLARYNTDGSLDSSFSEDGKVTTDFGRDESISSIALQSDSKIVVAGTTTTTSSTYTSDIALSRYNSDGSLDSTFSEDGKVITSFGGFESVSSIAIQSDGKIVGAGGISTRTSSSKIIIIRYNTDGSLDSSFDVDGTLTTDFGGVGGATSVAIQSDEKIVMAGSTNEPITGYSNFALARYNTDGSLDSSFDKNGKLTTDFGGYDGATSIAIQSDGKIVAAGRSQSGGDPETYTSDFAIARYNRDGSLDSTFDGDGKLIMDFEKGQDYAQGLAIYKNRIYVAGSSSSLNARGVVAAYLLGCKEQVFYKDNDQDGYGNVAEKVDACTEPSGYVKDSTDCNDSSASVHPGAEEICGNGKDDNCNGKIDEDCNTVTIWYRDADGDGFGNPAQTKVADIQPKGYVGNNLDCNDKNKTKGGPEVCDGRDNDCDGILDNGFDKKPFYSDWDGDGYGTPKRMLLACSTPPRFVNNSEDRNDDNPRVYPGAPELCDGRDNNQNGEIDEGFAKKTFYHDFDKDGYGRDVVTLQACAAPLNYVAVGGDCNDRNASIHPGAKGPPNDGIDNNCNGLIDEPLHNVVTDKGSALIGEQSETLQLTAQPNPAAHYFTLHIQSASNHAVKLRMIDEVGRVIEVRQGLTSDVAVTIGHNYRPGVYYAEALQDGNRASIRLIKQ